jgi:glutamine cyclotransferase
MRGSLRARHAAFPNHLGRVVLLVAVVALLVSCADSGPQAEPTSMVSAAPSATRAALASPFPTTAEATLESPLPTPTLAPPTVESPLSTPTLPAVETPNPNTPPSAIPICTVRIINTFPHDRAAYTQGLVFEDGGFYEGTGLNGQSTLRRVDLESGEVVQSISLSPEYFGEGIVTWQDRIVQLTWKSGVGFVYDKGSFELLDTFRYPTQGWGITHDGTRLIMTDGTATLHFWDPDTFMEIGSVEVRTSAGPVTRLNELEYIEGKVFANIYQTDFIAIIDPDTGQVTAWIDLRGLLGPEDYAEPVDVLNGIAYDANGGRLFVTGKLWPKLFEIEVLSPDGAPAPVTCR